MDMALKLWDTANLVTGFAVAQSLATTIAMAKGDFIHSLRGPREHFVAVVITFLFTAFYLVAICWCGSRGMVNANKQEIEIWCSATAGRCLTVILFTLIMLGTLGGTIKLNAKPYSMTHTCIPVGHSNVLVPLFSNI